MATMVEALKNFELTRRGDAGYQESRAHVRASPRQTCSRPCLAAAVCGEGQQSGRSPDTRAVGKSARFSSTGRSRKYGSRSSRRESPHVEIPGSSRNGGPEKRSGNAVLVFSAYEVNVGLSDSLFKPQGKAPVNK